MPGALHHAAGTVDAFGHMAERLHRLPGCNWCYRPDADAPAVGPPPFERNGHVTFGCLNKVAKMSPPLLQLWGQILRSVRGSKLLVAMVGEENLREGLQAAGGMNQVIEVEERLREDPTLLGSGTELLFVARRG